jgi:hypothetical protein
MVPFELSIFKPDGKRPLARLHSYGVTPPLADSQAAYGSPAFAWLRAEFATVNGVETISVMGSVALLGRRDESITLTVNE